MAMSVGTCECGCGEFDHQVGGWEELDEAQHSVWQKHRCDSSCASPCLVARCRESDGFWTWCPNCEVLCSGWFEEFSDEPSEDGVDYEECESGIESMPDGVWPPAIGVEIEVGFVGYPICVVDWVCLNQVGDPARVSSMPADGGSRVVHAVYAVVDDGSEVLVFRDDLRENRDA
jgi:hypothetical protein